MFSKSRIKVTKITSAVLIGFALFLGSSRGLFAGESSYRAVANGPSFHITSLHVIPSVGTEQWIVSGFAPGVGRFSQSVSSSDIDIDYSDGTASLHTNVVTSRGLTVSINVNWNNSSSPPVITQTVSVPNPSRTLTINFKRASSVTGNIGSFTIPSTGTGVTGTIGQRTVTP